MQGGGGGKMGWAAVETLVRCGSKVCGGVIHELQSGNGQRSSTGERGR